jgi:hypothetical protein
LIPSLPLALANCSSLSDPSVRVASKRLASVRVASKRLEFGGFSTADAAFAVDNVTVDWMEQAAKKAESYLEFQAFSRSSLIQQLEFDGFTPEEAEHGANAVGL